VIQTTAGEPKRSLDVRRLEVRKLFDYFLSSQPRREEVKDIDNSNSHASDAWATPALFWVHRDPLRNLCHVIPTLDRTPIRYTPSSFDAPEFSSHFLQSTADNVCGLLAFANEGATFASANGVTAANDPKPPMDSLLTYVRLRRRATNKVSARQARC
jgi:hypothetical protein